MNARANGRGTFICPYANWMPDAFELKPMPKQIAYPVDLHLHSTASDGLKSPSELCQMADKLKLEHIALSDHDTLDGQAEMQAAAQAVREARKARGDATPFRLLSCIELSSGHGGRVHILGYAPAPDDPALERCLLEAAEDRRQRAAKMLMLLDKQGLEIPEEQKRLLLSPHVGRAHIARALVKAGKVKSMQEAFDRFLAEGGSAYVPRKLLEPAEALSILKGAGAVTVFAHPRRLGLDEPQLYALLEELIAFGLDGVEAYHPSASRGDARVLDDYARRRGLLVTGGSDYHGDLNARTRMGRMPAGWASLREDIERLEEKIEARKR